MGLDGPKPWPLIGNMADAMKRFPHEMEIERVKKYGKIYGVFVGRMPTLIICDLDVVKKILIKDFSYFIDRRTFDFSKLDPVLNTVLTNLEGEKWKLARSLLSPAFTSGKLKALTPLLGEAAEELVTKLKESAKDGKSINVKSLFGAYTMDVIASAGFGINIDIQKNPNSEFETQANAIFKAPSMFTVFIFVLFPLLFKWIRIPIVDFKAFDYFKNLVNKMVERRKIGKEKRNDFLQLMLEAQETEEANDASDGTAPAAGGKKKTFLTNDALTGQSVQFFLAGFESVSYTMAFAAYELALHPTIQDKVIEEIDSACNKHGGVTYNALSEMPYLDMVISETLRFYPAAISLERKCVEDYSGLQEYPGNIHIPKGMIVGIPVYAIHHSEEHYPEPEKFDPERFTTENKSKRHPLAYLPFGAGPRNCIGLRFALLEVKGALVHILRTCRFETCPETEVPFKYTLGVPALRPVNGIWLKMKPRFSE